jgi:uncharacterized protein DUF1573
MRWTLAIALVAALLGVGLGVGLTLAELGPYLGTAPIVTGPDADTGASRPTPRAVVVGSDTFDFGVMEQDVKGTHTFKIVNEGNAPLALVKGSTTCKCTLSNLDHNRLNPGETANVELEWTTAGTGAFRHSATIKSNDPRRGYITLSIEGRVTRSHKVAPGELVFNSISVGDGAAADLYVYSFEDGPFHITRQEFRDKSTERFFELKVEEMSAEQVAKEEGAKSGKIVHLTLKPGLPLGKLEQRIRLTLDLPSEPMVEIPIDGRVVGDISIVGQRNWDDDHDLLALGTIEYGKGKQSSGMYLLVKGEHRDEVKMTVQSITPEFLKIHFDKPESLPDQPLVKIPFTIEVPPDAPPGEYTVGRSIGKIELETGHPTTPRLKMYVNFSVAK